MSGTVAAVKHDAPGAPAYDIRVAINDRVTSAVYHYVDTYIDVEHDVDSVREFWYDAECSACGWHTSGGQSNVNDEAYNHACDVHCAELVAQATADHAVVTQFVGLFETYADELAKRAALGSR